MTMATLKNQTQTDRSLRSFVLVLLLAGCGDDRRALNSDSTKNAAAQRVAKKTSQSSPRKNTISADIADHVSADAQAERTSTSSPQAPQPIHRPDDARPRHDDRRLAEMGIRLYESKRLKLYTDIDPEIARTLPPVIDAVYPAWCDYFGELPSDRAGSDFQMTGHLIKDEALFREAGLVPEDLPMFEHGRHRRNEFWMREQQYDYFRRHLLIHEATHCFMTFMPDVDAPVWYIEGMAEHFATHRIKADGSIEFRIMPGSANEVPGWGRISGVRAEFLAGKARSISNILGLPATEFLKPEPYAWSWALSQFLDEHPRYHQRFQQLSRHLQRGAFPREFAAAFNDDARDLATEWTLFVTHLQYGHNTARAAIDFQPGSLLTADRPEHRIVIAAERGWQSSGVRVEAGRTYEVSASGRVTLSDKPKHWVSEPQGISIRYFDGWPLGRLLGCVRMETEGRDGEAEAMLKTIDLGGGDSFVAPHTGTLYLRVNDAWNSLSENSGRFTVTLRRPLRTE